MAFCRSCGSKVVENAIACTSCGCPSKGPGKFCWSCGSEVPIQAIMCVKCGVALTPPAQPLSLGGGGVPPSKLVCALLAFLVPVGIHRFLAGHTTSGIVQLVLAILCAPVGVIWSWIDGVMILTDSFRMHDGRPLSP